MHGLDLDLNGNINVNALEVENVNLISVLIDISGSMDKYASDMQQAIAEFKKALEQSKEVDEILLSRIDFDSSFNKDGYKPVAAFNTGYSTGGTTNLYAPLDWAITNQLQYEKTLKASGTRVKSVIAVFTDGDDIDSTQSEKDRVRDIVKNYIGSEKMIVWIAFGSGGITEAKTMNIPDNRIYQSSASASELRKAFQCLSKSVKAFSQSATAPSAQADFFTL